MNDLFNGMEHYFNRLAEWFKGLPDIVQVSIIIAVFGALLFFRLMEIFRHASGQCKS